MLPNVVVEVKVFPNEGVADKARSVGVDSSHIALSRMNENNTLTVVLVVP